MKKNLFILSCCYFLGILLNFMGLSIGLFAIGSTPIFIGLVTGAILFGTSFAPRMKFINIFFVVEFYDLLVKLYAPGTHDQEGKGVIMAFQLIGLIIAFILFLIYGFTVHPKPRRSFFLYMLATFFIFLVYSYFSSVIGADTGY